MKPDALRMLARQLRADPNPDAIEDAAAALEAVAMAGYRAQLDKLLAKSTGLGKGGAADARTEAQT